MILMKFVITGIIDQKETIKMQVNNGNDFGRNDYRLTID